MSLYFQNSKLKRQVRHEIEIYFSMRMIRMEGNGRFFPLDKVFKAASRNGFESRKVRDWDGRARFVQATDYEGDGRSCLHFPIAPGSGQN